MSCMASTKSACSNHVWLVASIFLAFGALQEGEFLDALVEGVLLHCYTIRANRGKGKATTLDDHDSRLGAQIR